MALALVQHPHGMARALDKPRDHLFHRTWAILAACGVVAHDVLKQRDGAGEQRFGQVKQAAELLVVGYQSQLAVKNAEATRQVVQNTLQYRVAAAQFLPHRTPGGDVLQRADQPHRSPILDFDRTDGADPDGPPGGRRHR